MLMMWSITSSFKDRAGEFCKYGLLDATNKVRFPDLDSSLSDLAQIKVFDEKPKLLKNMKKKTKKSSTKKKKSQK